MPETLMERVERLRSTLHEFIRLEMPDSPAEQMTLMTALTASVLASYRCDALRTKLMAANMVPQVEHFRRMYTSGGEGVPKILMDPDDGAWQRERDRDG